MKRKGNLFEKIADVENIRLAERKASRGKENRFGVKLFHQNLERNILSIANSLINETYVTSEYHIFNIVTKEGKERTIYRLPYTDRVVHHAIMNVLEPLFVSVFVSRTYSCIKKRGIHKCLSDLRRDLLKNEEETTYCLKFDIRKFYPSINHEVLKSILLRKIKDQKLLRLLYSIIDSAPGVPIGNYLSQYFANLYLAYFDHSMIEAGFKYYYRYADDVVILSSEKEKLHEALITVNNLLKPLCLTLKSNYQIFPVEARGIDFVGYVTRHHYSLMRKTIKKRFAKKAAKLEKPCNLKHSLSQYYGWAIHCNSVNLLKKLAS